MVAINIHTNNVQAIRFQRFLIYSILFVEICISLLLFSDKRLNIIGESHGGNLQAFSIAISKLIYNKHGLVGYTDVLNTLKEIPSASEIDLSDQDVVAEYQLAANSVLDRATNIEIESVDSLHAYWNDLGFLYFVILSFSIFGINLSSLLYLWASIFFASTLATLFSFRNNINLLTLLLLVLSSIFIMLFCNAGVGAQLITVYNSRFISVLGIVPLIFLLFYLCKPKTLISDYVIAILFCFFIAFLLQVRGTAQWMLLALIFVNIYFLLADKYIFKNKIELGTLIVRFFSIALIMFSSFMIGKYMNSSLDDEYEKEIWNKYHVIWHPLVIGMTIDPLFFSEYACSDRNYEDTLKGYRTLICDEENKRFVNSRLYHGIFDPPSDMHGFNAAVKLLRENHSDENIGVDVTLPDQFNLAWSRYDSILKNVFFKMIKEEPVGAAYVFFIVKPLRFLKELSYYTKYFIKGLLNYKYKYFAAVAFLFLSLSLLYLAFLHSIVMSKDSLYLFKYSIYYPSIILFSLSAVPSVLFFSQAHTVSDSVTILIILFLLSMAFIFKKIIDSSNFLNKINGGV